MSTEGMIILLVIVVASLAWIGMPFLRRDRQLSTEALVLERQRDRIMTYYTQVVASIRDLDEDHAAGKIEIETYERERAEWAQRGIEVLKALDTLNEGQSLVTVDMEQSEDSLDDAIEAAVASYLRQTASPVQS